jgi:alpha-D-xyloside xylohydrolase
MCVAQGNSLPLIQICMGISAVRIFCGEQSGNSLGARTTTNARIDTNALCRCEFRMSRQDDVVMCERGNVASRAPEGIAELCVPHLYSESHWLDCYTRVKPTGQGAIFDCRLNSGRTAWVCVEAVAEDIVRVRYGAGSTSLAAPASPVATFPFQFSDRAPVVSFQAEEDKVLLDTGALVVLIRKSPFCLSICDRLEGGFRTAEPFFRQQVDDCAFGEFETLPAGFDYNPETDRWRARETFVVGPDESFYGLGEKFSKLNKRGQFLTSWTTDARSVHTQRSYKNIPFLMSSRHFGLLINASGQILYDLAHHSFVSACIMVESPLMDYFVIRSHSLKGVLGRYTDIVGRAPVPPKWSFGLWMSRLGYRSRGEVETVARLLRQRKISCDVIHIDPYWMGGEDHWCDLQWDQEHFPAPAKMLSDLRKQGFRVCLWISPYVPVGTPMFAKGVQAGYFVRTQDGEVYLRPPWSTGRVGPSLAIVDFTNPRACVWFRTRLERLLRSGVATFKTDFGEWAPSDGVYHSGENGETVHNRYPVMYNHLVYGAVCHVHGAKNGMVWGRSAYLGSHQYPVVWGGDSYPSFEDMACQLWGLLSLGLSGIPYCSHDIGGFGRIPSPELYVRWAQFGLLSSHSRCHGVGPREPWEFGEEAERIFRIYCNLRYRLIPYLYSEAHVSSHTGLPLLRPMVLDHENDRNTRELDLQYMLGTALLVAPVFGGTRREVYLPQGTWFNFWTHECLRGGAWIDTDAPLDKIPLYVRAGCVVPMQQALSYVDAAPSMDQPKLTLRFYVGKRADDQGARKNAVHYELHGILPSPIRLRWSSEDGIPITCALDKRPSWTRLEFLGLKRTSTIAVRHISGKGRVHILRRRKLFVVDIRGKGPIEIALKSSAS